MLGERDNHYTMETVVSAYFDGIFYIQLCEGYLKSLVESRGKLRFQIKKSNKTSGN